jgi:hypothetical protein
VKYVGFGVLAIAYWANVVLLHLLIIDVCPWPEHAVTVPAPATAVGVSAPAPAVPAVGGLGGKTPSTTHVYYPRWRGDEVDPFGGSEFGPMSRAALVAGLNGVRPLIHACYLRHQVPGTAMVNVTIAKSGRVSRAQMTGKFTGTETGACVEAAVKTAAFPPSDGFSTPYPFQLK